MYRPIQERSNGGSARRRPDCSMSQRPSRAMNLEVPSGCRARPNQEAVAASKVARCEIDPSGEQITTSDGERRGTTSRIRW